MGTRFAYRHIPGLFICLISMICAAQPATSAASEDEVRAAIARLQGSYRSCDADSQSELLHSRWSGFASGGGPFSESPDHLSSFKKHCEAGWRYVLTLKPQRIDAYDNWAIAMGATTGEVFNPEGELVREANSRWSLVYVKEKGSWRLYHGHLSPRATDGG